MTLIGIKLPKLVEPTGIMKKPCKLCPTAHYPPDEEVQEILKLSHEEQVKTAFACGWNPGKYCKGYCTLINATEKELLP